VTANGKLMAISICVPALCLLIFIKDPLLPLSVRSNEGKKTGVRIAQHTQYDLSFRTLVFGCYEVTSFFFFVRPLGFARLIYLAFLSCDKC